MRVSTPQCTRRAPQKLPGSAVSAVLLRSPGVEREGTGPWGVGGREQGRASIRRWSRAGHLSVR